MNQREVNRIIEQVEKLHNDNWTGIRLSELLDEVDDNIANDKLAAFNTTIHQLARHILATEVIVINRLRGNDYKIKAEEDWPPLETLASIKWTDTKKEFKESQSKLISLIEKLNDADLDKPIIKSGSTFHDTLHGHIQHSYYHIGQMVVIKNVIDKGNHLSA